MSHLTIAVMAMISLLLPGCGRPAPEAPGEAPDVVSLQGALANRLVLADKQSSVVARLRVGTKAPEQAEKAPINLALVIDTSGSMDGEAIDNARSASLALIDLLADGDRLAVVAFHSKSELLLGSTPLDEDNRAAVKDKIRKMAAQGTTDMAGGLRLGIGEVERHAKPDAINRVVLLGDGVPNDESPIRSMATSAGGRGITITALGLGLDYNESLMGAVAQLSGGRFHYVRSPDKVAAFFRSEVLRLAGVYARNAVVRLTPGPGVGIVEVVGRSPRHSGRSIEVMLGDLSRDDQQDLYVKLTGPAQRHGSSVELLDAVLLYDDAVGGKGRQERRIYLGAKATKSTADIEAGRNKELEDSVAMIDGAAKTLQAIETARQGNGAEAQRAINEAADTVQAQARKNDNKDLDKQASEMRALATELPSFAGDAAPSSAPLPPQAAPRPKPASPRVKHRIRSAHDQAIKLF